MRLKRRLVQVLILYSAFGLSAFAQLDSAALRAKLGAPVDRETFRLPAGFDLIVDYGDNRQVCTLRVPALMPTSEPVSNADKMKQRMYAFLAEIVPDSIRGKELRRMLETFGAVSVSFIEYEKVTVSETEAGQPFSRDNHITVTFKRDDCMRGVGR